MTDIVRIGVIGAGRIGRLHAANLAFQTEKAQLAAVMDVDQRLAEEVGRDCRAASVCFDHREIMEDKNIDAVYICSPTPTHCRLIIEAAAAGKQIFCEKPIDLDTTEIDRALEAVEKAGVKLFVGFNRRFDPNFQKARDLVREGGIGRVHLVRITSRDPVPPPLDYVKVSGGLFLDMTIHDFDMCRFLAGEEVREIYAQGTALIDPKVAEWGDVDTAVTLLTYDSGAYCVIDNSRQAVYGYDQRVEAFGSEGCVVVDNRTPHSAKIYNDRGVTGAKPLYFFIERYTEAYIEESRRFVDCVLKDTPPPVSGLDGKISVLMGLAAGQSMKEHRPVSFSPGQG